MRAGSPFRGLVVRVEQRAFVDREAAAADAGREPAAQRLEGGDLPVEVVAPSAGEPFPVSSRWRAAGGQAVERGSDPLQADPRGPAGLDQRDPAQDGAVVATLVAARSARRDQAPSL